MIDWTKMPVGTMTNYGEYLGMDSAYRLGTTTELIHCFSSSPSKISTMSCSDVRLDRIKIIPATKWTHWGGGDCPVPDGVLVDVTFRNGEIYLNQDSFVIYAKSWKWSSSGYDAWDIIAYRVAGVKK